MDTNKTSESATKPKNLTLKNVVAKNFLSSTNPEATGTPGKIVIASTTGSKLAPSSSSHTTKSPVSMTTQSSAHGSTSVSFNPNNMRQEKVKQNWDIIISALRSKANMEQDDPFLEMSGNFQSRHNYLHATDKENWIFFSIIISIVILLSILFCFLVFKFFPKYSE